MNLRELDQKIELWEGEAVALLSALQHYLHDVAVRATMRPMPLAEALSLRPLTSICRQLTRLLCGSWQRAGRGGQRPMARPRSLRLAYDELLQVLKLYQTGELRPLLPDQQPQLQCCLGKVHQRAQNLTSWFQL
jgi:hypothetical protein